MRLTQLDCQRMRARENRVGQTLFAFLLVAVLTVGVMLGAWGAVP